MDKFRSGLPVENELDIRAEKAYFLNTPRLEPKSYKKWTIVADVSQNINQIIQIRECLIKKENLVNELNQDIQYGSEELIRLVAAADGLQLTANGSRIPGISQHTFQYYERRDFRL